MFNLNSTTVKLEIFIPKSHFSNLQEALRSVGAGVVGNYDSVLSYSVVSGTWRPLPGAKPYDGEVGVLCDGEEYKVEVCCHSNKLTQTISAIKAIHPYEEPVINVIPLLNKEQTMKGFNVIWVFNPTGDKVLMCKRRKEPFKGLYNLVGGKIEEGEDGLTAAYRELREETNITDIELLHFMDFNYYVGYSCRLEVYIGKLTQEVVVFGDENPLVWIDVTEDFYDVTKFGGDGDIWHIYKMIEKFGV